MPYKNYGLKIVFADIDINTGTISPDCIKKKINSKTKLIVSSHFCGYMGFVEEIRKIASDNSVFLINDCFEAFETVPNEIKMKSLNCETYIYHFGPTKLPNTIDGGAIEFFDKKLYEKAICIRDLGIDRNTFRDSIGEIKKDIDIAYNSYGAMMTEVNSYIGVEQLNNLKEIKKINKKNFDYLLANLDYYIVYNTTMLTNSNHSNNWVFGFLSANKAEEMNNLRINHNLYASGVHTVINRYSIFGSNETFKIAEDFTSKFIAIPCGWWANYGND
jgi:dTDP-4-amino-4,6-dideoxygalactose transaminase